MMDDIPTFGESSDDAEEPEPEPEPEPESNDYDDSILDSAFDEIDEFELEHEVDGVVPEPLANQEPLAGEEPSASEEPLANQEPSANEEPSANKEPSSDEKDPSDFDELEDVPGLDDWLSGTEESEQEEIFDDLDGAEFDELLQSIESEQEDEPSVAADTTESTESLNLEEGPEPELKLDNPDLDLSALLNDVDLDAETEPRTPPEDFLDVEALMDDGEDNDIDPDSAELDLDVSLSDFTGVNDADDVIDIDKDAGQNANLDLARVYLEMDDIVAAKELLEDVMNLGSEEQKQEAEGILKSIS